jgi:hypothetical protein
LSIGLFSTADDQGRRLAYPELIKADIFPFDDSISFSEIEEDLKAIEANETICLYSINGTDYLQLINWWKYQSPQWAAPSDFPSPDGWKDRVRITKGKGQYIEENWRPDEEPAIEPEGNHLDDGNAEAPEPPGEPPIKPPGEQAGLKDKDKDKNKNKDPEGAAAAARAPPQTRKSRKKTPKSAAVEYYRSCTNRYPNRVQIRDIDAAVTNLTQLNVWKQSVDLWMRKGWNPQNIDGMLEVFKNGGKSKYDRGKDNAIDGPKPIPGYELADLDEVRRCQEEQWARERARAALPDVQGGGGGARPPPDGT